MTKCYIIKTIVINDMKKAYCTILSEKSRIPSCMSKHDIKCVKKDTYAQKKEVVNKNVSSN